MDYKKLDDNCKICVCLGVTMGDIRKEFKNGSVELEDIIRETQAGTRCKLCKIEKLDVNNRREFYIDEAINSQK